MISVNTNIANIRAQNCLTTVNSQLATALERMSTGYRINTAKDDAAGLYVGTNLNTQLRGLNVANQNAQMGSDLLNLADGALSQMTNNLLRVRDLAVQAANGIYTQEQRLALQCEADQLTDEIFKIKATTNFNGINIFNGALATVRTSSSAVASVSGGGADNSGIQIASVEISPQAEIGAPKTHKTAAELDVEYGSGNWVAITDRTGLEDIKNGLSKTYVLMGNVDLSGEDWVAIGTEDASFKGTFDGNGYTISNLNINSTENYQGLFGYAGTSSKFLNVHLEGGTIKGVGYVGALLGYTKSAIIKNCSSTVKVEAGSTVGGLVGHNYTGQISNSYATGNVSGNNYVGGLMGSGYAKIIDSYATGDVTGNSTLGGLAGSSFGGITNSFATGNVTGVRNVGGLVGDGRGNITNCYATGNVTGTDETTGGLVAFAAATITNCYASGNVTGARIAGGLVGELYYSSSIKDSISTSVVTRTNDSTDKRFGVVYGLSYGTVSNCYAIEQNFGFVGTEQKNVTVETAGYFNDVTKWMRILGAEYNYSTIPPTHISLQSGNIIQFQIGSNFSDNDKICVDTALDMNYFLADFTSTETAAQTIEQIDIFLKTITNKRTELGSVSNRIDSIMSSQRTKIENYSSAKSTITDADIAKESASLISKQILQQASSSLITQAGNIQKTIISQLINGL